MSLFFVNVPTLMKIFVICFLKLSPRLKLLTGVRNVIAPGIQPYLLPTLVPQRTIDIFLCGMLNQPDCLNKHILKLVKCYILETRRVVYWYTCMVRFIHIYFSKCIHLKHNRRNKSVYSICFVFYIFLIVLCHFLPGELPV